MKSNATNSFSLCLALILLLTLVLLNTGAGLSFIAHGSVKQWFFPVAFIVAACVTVLLTGRGRRQFQAIGASVVLIAAGMSLSTLVYDSTFDSVGYHYDTVVMLARGWNPVYEIPWNDNIWAQHYAKGLEVMQSAVLSTVNNLQAVKVINVMLVAASLCLMWYTLRTVYTAIGRLWRIGIVIIAALNPIMIQQMLSGYNDYALWPETIILLCGFSLTLKYGNRYIPWVLIALAVVLAVNTKFTHFFYIGIECIIFAVWCICYKRKDILVIGCCVVLAAVIVGVVVAGCNPYITNVAGYGSPVYPLGTDVVDIMTGNTPEMFQTDNRLVCFIKSLLSYKDEPWGIVTGNYSAAAMSQSYGGDLRVNGFGLLMAPMLLCSLLLMLFSKPRLRFWLLYLAVFALCLCFEQSWWARYIPFLWLALVMPVMCSLYSRHNKRLLKQVRAILLLLCVANGLVSVGATVYGRLSYTAYINYVFDRSKETGIPLQVTDMTYTFRQQFAERDVKYIEYATPQAIGSDSTLFRIFGIDFFESVVNLPPELYPEAYSRSDNVLYRLIRFDERRALID